MTPPIHTADPPLVTAPAPEGRRRALRIGMVLAQLVAVLVFIRMYSIESRAFANVFALAVAGFAVHAVLPARHRLRFFAALSTAAVIVALGVNVASVVLAVGAALLVICHLPLPIGGRIGLIVLTGAGLAVVRSRTATVGIPELVWPVLGSMFMFRLALYLQSLRHRKEPFSPALSWSYFFMLPNVCFPLFPIVDYKTFVRARFDANELAIYERGLHWIGRGLVHLLLYRLVFLYVMVNELFVSSLGDVLRYVLGAVLLYLNVSGQFHVIVGMLHLFGFRLPETHHLYLVAGSLVDYWRRINIYWRDFMLKLVYLPSFFALRQHPLKVRLVVSTLAVFLVSWTLHSYQFFWITGVVLLAWKDFGFWAIFGTLVAASVLWELRSRRRGAGGRGGHRWSPARAFRTVATFMVIAVLWSFWTAESGSTWWYALSQVRHASRLEWSVLVALVGSGLLVAGFPWSAPTLTATPLGLDSWRVAVRRGTARMAGLAALMVLAMPATTASFSYDLAQLALHLRVPATTFHEFLVPGGYYEETTGADGRGLGGARPDTIRLPQGAENTGIVVSRSDYLLFGLRPSRQTTLLGQTFTTNGWGMRDREYPMAKDSASFRIALVGASDVVGWGVDDQGTFDAIVEPRLDSLARLHGRRVEVLNFSVGGWSLPQRVLAVPLLAATFSPDLIVLATNPFELILLQRTIARAREKGVLIPDTALASIIAEARTASAPSQREMLLRLRPLEERLQRRALVWAAEEAGRVNASLVVLTLSSPHIPRTGTLPIVRRAAASAGVPVLECADVWRGHDEATLVVSDADRHPNAAGHRLIADCLYDRLRHSPLLRLTP